MNLANYLVSKLKGEKYALDESIPLSYIIKLSLSRGVSLLYGMLRLRTLKPVFVHPSSKIICAKRMYFGKGLSIGNNCYVNALSRNGLICGNNVSMGFHTHIELTGSMHFLADKMVVGSNVGLGSHGHFGVGVGSLEIGDDCIFGNYVSIHPENHVTDDLNTPMRLQGVKSNGGVKIGNNCWIGAKVTILDGTVIGNGCIVAAGAVVRGKFPDNAVIGGVPARILKMRE